MERLTEEDGLLMETAQEHENIDLNHEVQIEKIMNFQAITQTTNTDVAAKYLVQNDWDESSAAQQYYRELDQQDFENAQRIMYAQNQAQMQPDQIDEGEALIDNNINMTVNQGRNEGPGFFKYIIGMIGTGIYYIIPEFIKTSGRKIISIFTAPYPSQMFVRTLQEHELINQVNQHNPETAIDFKQEYFTDAVAEGKRLKKPILFILFDSMIEDNRLVVSEVFHDEEVLKILSNNYIVFGLETGSAEANSYTQEFKINEIPYFGAIMCKSDSEYGVLDAYNHEEFELEKFKVFLNDSFLTFESLIQYIGEDDGEEDFPIGGGVTMDETRKLKEQQRMDYMKAQEEDMNKLVDQTQKELQKQKQKEEKVNFENSK